MTTPDTAAVRAWARSNGYDVADRGRLPAELTAAYLARADGSPKAGAKTKAAGKAAVKAKPAAKTASKAKPAARTSTKPAVKATSKAVTASAAPAESPAARIDPTPAAPPRAAETAPRPEPRPKPSPVNDDRRLVALGEQLTALTDRVAALEKAAGSRSPAKVGGGRFRRSR